MLYLLLAHELQRREISERQCRVKDLAKARSDVLEQAAQGKQRTITRSFRLNVAVRAEIAARTERLRNRGRLLEEAGNFIPWHVDQDMDRELETARLAEARTKRPFINHNF